MTYLVELPVTADGGPAEIVKVQISGPTDGLVKVARPGQVVARATRSLGEMPAGVPNAYNRVRLPRCFLGRKDPALHR